MSQFPLQLVPFGIEGSYLWLHQQQLSKIFNLLHTYFNNGHFLPLKEDISIAMLMMLACI
jgi:hypothetical protein